MSPEFLTQLQRDLNLHGDRINEYLYRHTHIFALANGIEQSRILSWNITLQYNNAQTIETRVLANRLAKTHQPHTMPDFNYLMERFIHEYCEANGETEADRDPSYVLTWHVNYMWSN